MTKKATATPKKPRPATAPAVKESIDYTILPNLTEGRLKFADTPLSLLREALLFNYRPYDTVKGDARPARRGFIILLLIILIVALARGVQLILGFLTSPRLGLLAEQILARVTQLDWYTTQATANPGFTTQFGAAYDAVWQLIRLLGGFPSATGTISSLLGAALSLLLGWLLYGLAAHGFARWFGGRATYGQFLGPLALSYAPTLLLVLELIPGFTVPLFLIFFLMLITKFMTIRRTYLLSPGYSLAVLIAPYVVGLAIAAIVIALAVALGLEQIPYLNPILGFFTQ
jgi:hypothetical protein